MSIPVRTVSSLAVQSFAQLDGRAHGTQRIVLVGGRHAEESHDATVLQSLDRGAVALEHRADNLEGTVAESAAAAPDRDRAGASSPRCR